MGSINDPRDEYGVLRHFRSDVAGVGGLQPCKVWSPISAAVTDAKFADSAPYILLFEGLPGSDVHTAFTEPAYQAARQAFDRDMAGEGNLLPGRTAGETVGGINVLRSLLWRAEHGMAAYREIFVCTEPEQDIVIAWLRQHNLDKRFKSITLEQLVSEARALTFEAKAAETLLNMSRLFEAQPGGFPLPHVSYGSDHALTFDFKQAAAREFPMPESYGCNRLEDLQAIWYLCEQGFLYNTTGIGELQLTPRGFAQVVSFERRGGGVDRRVFLVRKYSEDLDKFLRPVVEAVSKRLSCPVLAIWEREHNEQIDEEILRSIRLAYVVVANLDADNFNVGFEVGYALALGKPIVAIRKAPETKEEDKRPFDLGTLNCYDYTTDDEGTAKLIDRLVARIGLELDKQPANM